MIPRVVTMADQCKKCGNRHVGTAYDGSLDTLRKTCANCGYGWNEAPLDRKDHEGRKAALDLIESMQQSNGSESHE